MPSLRELTEYHKPTNLDEAIKLLQRPQVRTVPLAGGTQLVPSAAHHIEAVVDLSSLNLSYIKSTSQGIAIGATTTLQQIVDDEIMGEYADGVLITAMLDSASLNTRNAASIAGSIVGAAGNSPLLTTLLALDARLIVRGDREQEVSVANWVAQHGTLILKINLPALADHTHLAYEKVARTPADLPIVCVAVRATIDKNRLANVRLALGGVAGKPIVIEKAESTIEQAAQLAVESIDPPSDYFATAEYRREMIDVLVKRTLKSLV
ncbi:MAG TPA: FAD binding domain-containing protein [Anaerolineae bacterium]|nr:FAD binding domain-containing protein [Anaerolineae bacterium]